MGFRIICGSLSYFLFHILIKMFGTLFKVIKLVDQDRVIYTGISSFGVSNHMTLYEVVDWHIFSGNRVFSVLTNIHCECFYIRDGTTFVFG